MFVPLTGDDFDPMTYDRGKFYTLGAGRVSVHVKLTEEQIRMISKLCMDERFQHYQTRVDFIRDAVMHRLHDITGMLNDPKEREAMEQRLKEEQSHYMIREMRAQMDELRSTVNDAIDLLRSSIQKATPPTDQQIENMWVFLTSKKRAMDPEQEAELRLLLLYFVPSPAQMREMGIHPRDEDVELWRKRQDFWEDKDHMSMLTVEMARALELMT